MSTTRALVRPLDIRRTSPFRDGVKRHLRGVRHGRVTLIEDSHEDHFGSVAEASPQASELRVQIHTPRVYQRIAVSGTLGAGESFVDGEWSTNDLTRLIRLIIRNPVTLNGLESGLARVGMSVARGWGALRQNTRRGSRQNIQAHYDLGNEFFSRMLDPTMAYSSGVFETEHSSLEQASVHKFDLLSRMLQLNGADRVLEIGTGWGGLTLHMAREFGCHVTTTIISKRQHAFAQSKIREAGLDESVSLLDQDYRDLTGQFDKLVSVEMIEAVGARFYDAFFQKCDSLLAPGGLFALQTITIGDQEYESQRRETDFIKRYVFPGSNLPSMTALTRSMTSASSLRVRDAHDYGHHYARTLAAWRNNLLPHEDWVVQRYGARFWRTWLYYLAYCEAAFLERYISVKQILIEKPSWRTS